MQTDTKTLVFAMRSNGTRKSGYTVEQHCAAMHCTRQRKDAAEDLARTVDERDSRFDEECSEQVGMKTTREVREEITRSGETHSRVKV